MPVFRTSIRNHRLLQHLQARVETDLRVWRYLLPPLQEEEGHEVMGSLPVWCRTETTGHFLCDTGLLTIDSVLIVVSVSRWLY
jgi:hypothetical protein